MAQGHGAQKTIINYDLSLYFKMLFKLSLIGSQKRLSKMLFIFMQHI